ncbi:hypothetical protein [Rhizobium paknamense]|uniref:Helix-turn-helix domain-containing protein n=1 Tax=Rhizobium paknamense TaxID=1206817 RepID=A0ABU0I8X9_9HYPH|nr:hypothetical protein [Rhizobium paknamense]MDQ0454696.1 hypothetical protein [Rhizobium paknamense]
MAEIRVPAHIQPYVTAIGIEQAIEFLLAFGGSYVYLSENPQKGSSVAAEMGMDAAMRLAAKVGSGALYVPTAKPFIASHLKYNKGLNTNDIARKLHTTHKTVSKWLRSGEANQLDLFDY